MSRALTAAVAVLVLGGLTGCMDDEGGTDPGTGGTDRTGDHAARLDADRTAAGDVVRTLAPGLAADLDGAVRTATGSFRGCRERTPEGIAAFEYVATARVDAGPAAPQDLLDPVPTSLQAAGTVDLATSDVPGGRRVATESEGLAISVTARPDAGRFVLVQVIGGCHEVPADEEDAWLDRETDDLT